MPPEHEREDRSISALALEILSRLLPTGYVNPLPTNLPHEHIADLTKAALSITQSAKLRIVVLSCFLFTYGPRLLSSALSSLFLLLLIVLSYKCGQMARTHP
jgi:hypothetical protein